MFFYPQALPSQPVRYQSMMTGADQRWWRTLLALPLFLILFGISSTLLIVGFSIVLGMETADNLMLRLGEDPSTLQDPTSLSFMLGFFVGAIPAVLVTYMVCFRVRPGWANSVTGRMRWSWMGISTTISLMFSLAVVLGSVVVEAGGMPELDPNPQLVLVLCIILIMVPLQSAAEEYIFRGLLSHMIGSLIRPQTLSLTLSVIVTSVLFALIHGATDPSTLTQLAGFGAIAWYVTYRTGGLESAIGIHTMNNTVIFVFEAFKGKSESLVNENTVIPWSATLLVLTFGLMEAAAILFAYSTWSAQLPERQPVTNPALRPEPNQMYLSSHYFKGKIYPEYMHLYPEQVRAAYFSATPTVPEAKPSDQPPTAPGVQPDNHTF